MAKKLELMNFYMDSKTALQQHMRSLEEKGYINHDVKSQTNHDSVNMRARVNGSHIATRKTTPNTVRGSEPSVVDFWKTFRQGCIACYEMFERLFKRGK